MIYILFIFRSIPASFVSLVELPPSDTRSLGIKNCPVTPPKAGVDPGWIPAFAGMTGRGVFRRRVEGAVRPNRALNRE